MGATEPGADHKSFYRDKGNWVLILGRGGVNGILVKKNVVPVHAIVRGTL
jgi:hypothetical protein